MSNCLDLIGCLAPGDGRSRVHLVLTECLHPSQRRFPGRRTLKQVGFRELLVVLRHTQKNENDRLIYKWRVRRDCLQQHKTNGGEDGRPDDNVARGICTFESQDCTEVMIRT